MRALVTGASYGIGGATCRKLAMDAIAKGEPAKIVATATGARPDLKELVEELKSLGAEAIGLTGDLSDRNVPKRLVAEAVEFCGGLDALVSNAVMRHKASLLELEVDDWDRSFAVNTRATWLLAKAAYPALKASGGSIVAVTSIAGIYPHAHYGPYAPSKAALINLVEMLAAEWGPEGIRVNGIAPGMTRTRNAEPVYANKEILDARSAAIPLGRVADPSEMAGAIALLLSKDASYITGQNVVVDGGYSRSIMAFVPGKFIAKSDMKPK
jgi:NAD(P)-dependent dehydrogenase (short-subunit alcohol dehydrogenase family)